MIFSGSISEYTPAGMQITFTDSLARPRGLAFDSSGNLFAAVNYFRSSQSETRQDLEIPSARTPERPWQRGFEYHRRSGHGQRGQHLRSGAKR